jgi:hypothetical protein
MLDVASQDTDKLLRPTISGWSRHSRRTVLTQRSATAFASGACTGVRITRSQRDESGFPRPTPVQLKV